MKKLLFLIASFFALSASAQNTLTKDEITVKTSLKIGAINPVTGVSNDLDTNLKRNYKLATEYMAKEYFATMRPRRVASYFVSPLRARNDSTVYCDIDRLIDSLTAHGFVGGSGDPLKKDKNDTIAPTGFVPKWKYDNLILKTLYGGSFSLPASRFINTGGYTLSFYNNTGGSIRIDDNGSSLSQANVGVTKSYVYNATQTEAVTTATANGGGVNEIYLNEVLARLHVRNASKQSYFDVNPGYIEVNAADSFRIKNLSLVTDTNLNKLVTVTASGKTSQSYWPVGGGGGSGIGYLIQSTAPTDTTKFWLDNSTGAKGVWPLKQKIIGVWRTLQWYDPVANFLSPLRPLYVLGTGQSNMLYRAGGGDLTPDNRVLEYISGSGTWAVSDHVASTGNNIAMQFARQVAKKQNRIVRYVVVAEVAKPIEDWYPGGLKTIEIANIVREAQIDSFDQILFRQGERNAELFDTESAYTAKISTVFNAYRDSSWFGKSGRAILGGMNEQYINTGVFNYYYHMNNGERGGIGLTGVSTLGLSQADGIHQSGATIDTVGKRYADVYFGKPTQYSLEKTPNSVWLGDSQFGVAGYSTNPAAYRLINSVATGMRGGYLKYDITTSIMSLGYNGTNNGTVANDSGAVFVNGFSQVGIGLTNNTLTSNKSLLHIRSTGTPIAFSIGNSANNAAQQQDTSGYFLKPIVAYNQYATEGEIVLKHQSAAFENGRIRFTRASSPTVPNYNGMYIHFNGLTNQLLIGAHSGSDTANTGDVPVIGISQTGTGLSIKKSTAATAYLDIAASTGSTNTAPIKLTAGTNLGTPANGAIEFDGTNYYVTQGGVRYSLTQTLTGNAAPTTTPTIIGQRFVDFTNKKEYVATGTASSADWTILN